MSSSATDDKKGPLDGIKIVELTSVVLGPYASQMLGDLGAEVIKIEPLVGDTNRNLGPFRTTENMRALYLNCNRNKRSIALDLKSKEGLSAALEIIKSADIVIHNFRPSAMERLGLDYERVKAVNPEVVYCATYGYSKKGPLGDKGALDDSIQAASGIAMLQSAVEGDPRYLPTVLADKTTALNVVQAVLAALFHKERTGEGQEVEVPMFESMVSFVMTEHLWGQTFDPPIGKAGYVRLMAKHRRPYRTKDDKYIALLPYWDNHWKTFCELAGRPELVNDERFLNMKMRLENIDESYRITGEVVLQRTRAEWIELLGSTNVPMMIVNTLDELIDDEQLNASGFWQEMDHPTEGRIRMASSPINFSKTPTSIRRMPPHLGEHSEEILSEAGITQEQIATMFENGTVKTN